VEYHQTVNKIVDILKNGGFWFETFEHEEVRTSEEAARVRTGYGLEQGAKALIVKVYLNDGQEKFFMLVMPANLKLDSKKACEALGAKKIRFASEDEVSKITDGVRVGGVPPFGNLFNLDVVVDPQLFDNEKIVFNAGDRRFSVAMKSEDYKTIVVPQIASIT
jgi:prolyl-tRNA editing enzyme YbaK/EbsC (Cys-tRNA(Pro) deacylase)